MMTSKRLQPLQDLADYRKDQAARQLQEAQSQLAERLARLEELTRYRQDYERSALSAAPQLLRNRHAFIGRLREAEHFQQQLVEQAQRAVEQQRGRWLQQHRESATVAQLGASYRRREQHAAERRDQGQLDELALRAHVRREAQ